MAEFQWWLLLLGLVAGGGIVAVVYMDSARRDQDIADKELPAEALLISERLSRTGHAGRSRDGRGDPPRAPRVPGGTPAGPVRGCRTAGRGRTNGQVPAALTHRGRSRATRDVSVAAAGAASVAGRKVPTCVGDQPGVRGRRSDWNVRIRLRRGVDELRRRCPPGVVRDGRILGDRHGPDEGQAADDQPDAKGRNERPAPPEEEVGADRRRRPGPP